MLEFARPAFLVAGALAALVPPVLHLIARRPPERAPLPTARFLRPDARTRVRVQRRPTDLLLLLLRSAFLLLLGAALAGPSWVPARAGTLEVVLLDRGAGMGDAWAEAVDTALALVARGGDVALVRFDTTHALVRPTGAALDSLAAAGPVPAEADYAEALRGLLAATLAHPDADSVRATLVTRARWGAWSPALARLREEWPGAIRVVAVSGEEVGGEAPVETSSRSRAVVIAGEGAGAYATAALEALGWEATVLQGDDRLPEDAAAYVVLAAVPRPVADALLDRAREGATVIAAGVELPGALEAAATPGGRLVLDDGTVLDGAVRTARIAAPAPRRVLGAWGDGTLAAVALPVGTGCLVTAEAALESGRAPLSPTFPAVMARLLAGCAEGDERVVDPRPLDAAARAKLERAELPATVEAEIAGAPAGQPLGRWLLLLALAVALAETWIAYGRRHTG